MKKAILLGIICIFACALQAQSPAKYWVEFSDKDDSPYSIERPEEFLSPRALEKRARFNIEITEEDLPVNPAYIRQLLAIDSNMVLLTRSKWLNGVTVYSTTEGIKEQIEKLNFVTFCECTAILDKEEDYNYPKSSYTPPKKTTEVLNIKDYELMNYGHSAAQIGMNQAHWLHLMGAHGEGMVIAVFDGGFENADEIPQFEALRKEGRLLGTKNFVFPGHTVFANDSHGTMVLSCMTGYEKGVMMGTAPKASFYLAQTEDGRSENKIEEDNWVAAIEWADSLGVDVVNSSLGYHAFDIKEQSYKYSDLDGKTSRSSIAASKAASKGIVVCISAGNSGNDKWHYITPPADAANVITVGAVTYEGSPAIFSSYGPSFDYRVKPDAAAVGKNSVVATPEGVAEMASGTSFASPILCGMVACLWQLFPEATPMNIINMVRATGHRSSSPTAQLGYGITNFLKAYNTQSVLGSTDNIKARSLLYPPQTTTKSAVKVHYEADKGNEKFTIRLQLDGSDEVISQSVTVRKFSDFDNNQRVLNPLKLKLPKLPKEKHHGIVRVRVTSETTGDSYEEVIGIYRK